MPSLSLRDLSEHTYEGLRQLAIANHRSMQEQARLLIEREVRYAQVGALAAGPAMAIHLGSVPLRRSGGRHSGRPQPLMP